MKGSFSITSLRHISDRFLMFKFRFTGVFTYGLEFFQETDIAPMLYNHVSAALRFVL